MPPPLVADKVLLLCSKTMHGDDYLKTPLLLVYPQDSTKKPADAGQVSGLRT